MFLVLSAALLIQEKNVLTSEGNPEIMALAKAKKQVKINKKFGIETDSFKLHFDKVKKNELLSTILLRHHIPYPTIDKIVKKSKNVFDVRQIVPGKKYTIFTAKNDPKKKAQYFVYEKDAINYIVINLNDTVLVQSGKNSVEVIKKTVSGTINSSLYLSLKDKGASPLLTYELADIFAWQIDFHRIQKGDAYKVVYEEKYVNGRPIGIGKIEAASFTHFNSEYYAFYFDQDGVGEYFDEEAGSLRKAFLKAPVKFSRISSKYSPKRFHPVQKRYKAHLGTDYAAPTGTPIFAVGDGQILEATRKRYNGKYVKLRHNSTYTTQYLHMSKIAKGMKPGKKVRQGQIIGYVGSTGLATGPHVCFRFWKNGRQVDHLREKFPPSKPVDKKHMDRYKIHLKKMMKTLDEIDSNESIQEVAMLN